MDMLGVSHGRRVRLHVDLGGLMEVGHHPLCIFRSFTLEAFLEVLQLPRRLLFVIVGKLLECGWSFGSRLALESLNLVTGTSLALLVSKNM